MRGLSLFLLAVLCSSGVLAKKGFGPGEQEWGYVKVRPSANMFWWLYYTTANVSTYYEKPLIIWLQGGPGASSTSYGNFEEIGPLDPDLKQRNSTWVRDYNVLFIDNPVGTGFSYTTSPSGYVTTNAQIAKDLVECIKGFLKELPKFANVSTYIVTESYGGKMSSEFALAWYKEQKAGTIKSNLKGVALSDSWISPIDSVLTWAPYLLEAGLIDNSGFQKLDKAARMTESAVKAGKWQEATSLWGYTENIVIEVTDNVDFYNILTHMKHLYGAYMTRYPRKLGYENYARDYALDQLMNGPVKKTLQLPVNHGEASNIVFNKLEGDFMKPVVNIVETLLNTTDLKVFVLSGNLDLIVDTPGTYRWVDRMNWVNSKMWHASNRQPLVVNDIIEGYEKSYGKFAMYWINRAGHMVPKDNPAAMFKILKTFTA